MITYRISKAQAEEFFRNEVLFEDSRIDGYTLDDMVRILTGDSFKFICSGIGDTIIAVTAFKKVREDLGAEVHTFVLPLHRKYAVEALKSHIKYLGHCRIPHLYTTCSNYNMKVMNFLIKRLGFYVYNSFEVPETRDGEPVILYNLCKVV